MFSLRKIRPALYCLGLIAFVGTAGWASGGLAQDRESPPQRQEEEEGGDRLRRRPVRIVLPYSELEDLTPKQEETIREIRREIMVKRDELDREERERVLAVLTESQRARVAEIEAERAAREAEQRERARENREAERSKESGGGNS